MKAHRRYHFASRCCPAAAPCATCPPPARALVAPQASAEEQVLERAAPPGADACRRRPGATRPTLSRRVAVQGLPDNASRSRDGGTAPRAPPRTNEIKKCPSKQRGGLYEDEVPQSLIRVSGYCVSILRLVKSRFFVKSQPRKSSAPSERCRFQKVSERHQESPSCTWFAYIQTSTSGAKIIVTDHIIIRGRRILREGEKGGGNSLPPRVVRDHQIRSGMIVVGSGLFIFT